MTEAASKAESDLRFERKIRKIDSELSESLLTIAEGYNSFALRCAGFLFALSVLIIGVYLGTADSLGELKLILLCLLPLGLVFSFYFGYLFGVRSRLKVERSELNRFDELRSPAATVPTKTEAKTPAAESASAEG